MGTEIIAPDGTNWKVETTNCAQPGRRGQQNLFKDHAGPTPYAKRNVDETCGSAWRLMIDGKILKHVLSCTIAEARRTHSPDWVITIEELEAFLAIIYVRGAIGAKCLDLDALWSVKWGNDFVKATMSRDRFREIMKFLRFDVRSTRTQRLTTDKFGLISEVWYNFISNAQSCYTPGPYITIDEQLFPSKCRCRFTQFMGSKPDKYGQKFWLAVDKDSKYIVNAFPYLGKDDVRSNDERLGDYVVKKLMQPYLKKGRNVTCDNFFTSLSLAETLKSNGTSIVGTINKARREIPACVKQAKEELYSTVVLKKDDITLTVYQGKHKKNVLLLSTMHTDIQIETGTKKKPDVVSFYNSSKYGVDVVDQMGRKYSVKAPSRRWPVHTFYNLLDLAALNCWILYRDLNGKKISRREFILQLGEELAEPYANSRKTSNTRINIPNEIPERQDKRTRCQVKSSCAGNKSCVKCQACKKTVCKKCTSKEFSICSLCDSD